MDTILGPSQGQNAGNEGSPAPVTNPKYAKYYEMNKETSEAGTSDGDSGESSGSQGAGETPAVKPAAPTKVEKPESKKEEPGHKSGYDRRISVLTAREKAAQEKIRLLEERLAKLEQPSGPKPKLTRDNFLTDADYEQHREQELTSQVEQRLTQKQLEQAKQSQEQQAFRSGWVERVNNLYTSPERREQLAELIRTSPDNIHPDAHEYIRDSEVGPMMLEAFLLRPDFAEQVSKMPAIRRATTLGRLEDGIRAHLESQRASTPPSRAAGPKVSAAPAPIGTVGGGASGTPDPDSLPSVDSVREYRRKKYGR